MRFFAFLKEHPCARCGDRGVEVAHLNGLPSPKTGLPLPRRKGIAYAYAIPLCPECHRTGRDSIHEVGEAAFFQAFGKGDGYGPRLAARYLAAYAMSLEEKAPF